MKKGRHRRFEEARALKRQQTVDYDEILETMPTTDDPVDKPEHAAWADVAAEYESDEDDESDDATEDSEAS
ncbi:MAG: hypothetical protein IH940_11390 [Acidobacteria bacterium]|nr:hypothetical protein [Acidobacteriota bacterium]